MKKTFSIDFEIGRKGEFEPDYSFTKDYMKKEDIMKLLKEFPPLDGNKKISRSAISWTCNSPDNGHWVDIFVYHPEDIGS